MLVKNSGHVIPDIDRQMIYPKLAYLFPVNGFAANRFESFKTKARVTFKKLYITKKYVADAHNFDFRYQQ